jgi:hypothetical protein
MSPLRWIPTIVAFPLGGLLAVQVASTQSGFLFAALAGLIAGAVLGFAQWLALRPAVHPLWIVATSVGVGLGAGLGSLATASSTAAVGLVIFGAIEGAIVGAAQGMLLRRGILKAVGWMLVLSASWAVAWLITAAVIVDEQRGYVTFGLSGAALVTVVTGLVLRLMLGARVRSNATAVTA